MGKIIKRHSSFLAWVFLPSLLLLASVFGVNIVSKPGFSILNSSCGSFTADPFCNSLSNPCLPELCSLVNSLDPFSQGACVPQNPADPWTIGSPGTTCACNSCGNGRCEPAAGENTTTCVTDCPAPAALTAVFAGCTPNTVCSPTPDACCPGIQCTAPTAAGASCLDVAGAPIPGCDPDCCFQCGDGVISPPETCEPGIPGCAQGETCVNCQCVAIPTACPTNPAIPASLIQCIPDATTVGCDLNCHCDIVSEGSGCGGKKDFAPLNAACVPLIAGASGTSVVPPSLFASLNPTVLGGLFTLIGVPGGVYAASRWRKKRKQS